MSSSDGEGVFVDRRRQGDVQWKIPVDAKMRRTSTACCYRSPPFHFLGKTWYFKFFPNGEKANEKYFTVHLDYDRVTEEVPLLLNICLNLCLDNVDETSGIKHRRKTATHKFESHYIWSNVLQSDSAWAKESLSAITISCFVTEDSLPLFTFYESMWRKTQLSEDLKKIYNKLDNTDVTIRVKGQTFSAHRLIIMIRSPKLNSMYSVRNPNLIEISDCDPVEFDILLQFLYTGTVAEEPSFEGIIRLYDVAASFCEELAKICLRYMVHVICENLYNGETFAHLVKIRMRSLATKYNNELLLRATAEL